jgi:hypothetical protein
MSLIMNEERDKYRPGGGWGKPSFPSPDCNVGAAVVNFGSLKHWKGGKNVVSNTRSVV